MRGQVLGVDANGGVILGADDGRLSFVRADWCSEASPQVGQVVDYIAEDGKARHIYVIPHAAQPAHAAQATSSFVLGAVGVICLAIGLVIPVLPTLAAFIFGVIGAGHALAEGDRTALTLSRIAWIGALLLIGLGVVMLVVLLAFFGSFAGFMMHFDAAAPIHT